MKASLAAATALVAASVCSACGGTGPEARSAGDGGTEASAVPTRVRGNQIVLTAKQSRALLGWAERFRICLADRGVETAVRVTRRDVSLAVDGGAGQAKLLKVGTACGELLGGPPPRASLQVFDGMFVLYLPKQCLLDAKVAAEGA
jgi:hypothetical protein